MRQALTQSSAPSSQLLRASVKGSSVFLSWSTSGERSNAGFIVDRKSEGEEEFVRVATFETTASLKGQGTSSKKKSYRFVDDKVELGKSYLYKLSDCDSETGAESPLGTAALLVEANDEVLPAEEEVLPFKFGMNKDVERIHGYLALAGLIIGLATEALTSKGILEQIQEITFNLTRP